jgi:tRNA-specific 2-thiouridylase
MARVLAALSGGVDSSVAAALLLEEGHEVVGATMKLWGGRSDSGCCSVKDVEDARRVAHRLGIEHHVFNFTDEFERHVVEPYVEAHRVGLTPNPCIECNRHLKFDTFVKRGLRLGFDYVATGHYARLSRLEGSVRLLRALDRKKDQSYVLSCLEAGQLSHLLLPLGELTKPEVRTRAERLGLVTAAKADSQEVCFIAGGSGPKARRSFLEPRLEFHRGVVVDSASGELLGEVPAVELVTVGQRRGLGVAVGEKRYVVAVDIKDRRVVLGEESELRQDELRLTTRSWTRAALPPGTPVQVQGSAHGSSTAGVLTESGVRLLEARRLIAAGQTVALYDGDKGEEVLGAGVVTAAKEVAA